MKNKGLFFFIFGILFYEIIFPILDGLSTCILGYFQLIQGKQAVQLTKYQKEIQDLNPDKDEELTPAIGFHVNCFKDSEEEEDQEEDE